MNLSFITHKEILKSTKITHKTLLDSATHYEYEEKQSYVILKDKKEAKKYEKKGYSKLNKQAIDLAKALQCNEAFNAFIANIKGNKYKFQSIPFILFENYKYAKSIKNNISLYEFLEYTKSDSAFSTYINEIEQKYNVNPILIPQIPTIIKYNALFLPFLQDIIILPEYKHSNKLNDKTIIKECKHKQQLAPSKINIQVSSNISPSAIVKFIKKHSRIVKNKTRLLKKDNFHIKQKSLEIVRLKYKGLKIKDIVEVMNKKYYYTADIEAKDYTLESVKKAYQRAGKVINSLFSIKKGTKS